MAASGGGIYIGQNAILTFTNGQIIGNNALSGGGIYCENCVVDSLSNTLINKNTNIARENIHCVGRDTVNCFDCFVCQEGICGVTANENGCSENKSWTINTTIYFIIVPTIIIIIIVIIIISRVAYKKYTALEEEVKIGDNELSAVEFSSEPGAALITKGPTPSKSFWAKHFKFASSPIPITAQNTYALVSNDES